MRWRDDAGRFELMLFDPLGSWGTGWIRESFLMISHLGFYYHV